MTWCFGFPYAPNEPIRAQAWEIVQRFYAEHFLGIPQLVHSATEVGEPFLRAKTRNQLVRMADGFDIIVLVDADTLIHPDGIHRMLERAESAGMFLGKPFKGAVNVQLRRLAQIATGTGWPPAKSHDEGAAWIIRPSSWWAAGGMDEGFRSWGAEDTAFEYMFTALGGTIAYDQHPAVKAMHATPRWSRDPQWADTWERAAVTRHIAAHPELAHGWLKARNEPAAPSDWITRYNIDVKRHP